MGQDGLIYKLDWNFGISYTYCFVIMCQQLGDLYWQSIKCDRKDVPWAGFSSFFGFGSVNKKAYKTQGNYCWHRSQKAQAHWVGVNFRQLKLHLKQTWVRSEHFLE